MFIQPRADGLTASHRAPFFPSGSRFSPSYFRVVGRSHEFASTVTHELSVTIGVELTSLDVDPKMAFDVAYHGFAAGRATPGLYVVVPGLLRFLFFGCFNIFLHGFFRLLRAGLLISASDDVREWKSLLLLRWGGTSCSTSDIMDPLADGLTASHRAPFFPCGSRFSPSYFRVVGRSHEFTFTVTVDVVGVELTSLDVDPKMAFDVVYHGLAAGHCNTGPSCVAPGLLRFFFFLIFKIFFHGCFEAFWGWAPPSPPSPLPQMMSGREVLAAVKIGGGGAHPEAQLTLWRLANEWCKLW